MGVKIVVKGLQLPPCETVSPDVLRKMRREQLAEQSNKYYVGKKVKLIGPRNFIYLFILFTYAAQQLLLI